jgi:hypothetical protein
MTLVKENFVTDAKGNKIAVLLPIKDYNKILGELEELEEVKAYDKAMGRRQTFIPLNQALKEIEAARKKKK